MLLEFSSLLKSLIVRLDQNLKFDSRKHKFSLSPGTFEAISHRVRLRAVKENLFQFLNCYIGFSISIFFLHFKNTTFFYIF